MGDSKVPEKRHPREIEIVATVGSLGLGKKRGISQSLVK